VVRRLIGRTYLHNALDELIPLYAVYPLLFAAHGLSTGQISLLYITWSLTGFVLEVPSGALADRMSRRKLLVVASLVRAVGYTLWMVTPSFTGFAIGFVLWGACGALQSGTWEALVYDELAAAGAAKRYGQVLGRTEVIGSLAVLGSTALAVPAVALGGGGLGGYRIAGWASVAVCLAAAAVAASLPETPRRRSADDTGGFGGYLRTLRGGTAEAARSPRVRRLLAVAALLPGFTALDEYVPLLAGDTGVAAPLVPVLLAAPFAGMAAGSEAAGRWGRVGPRRLAGLTAAGAVLLAAGALSGRPLGFLPIGLTYGLVWYGWIIVGTRLQHTMTGAARATVTSVAGLGEEVVALAVFAGYGLASASVPLKVVIGATAVPMLLLAAAMRRWVPPAGDEDEDEEDECDGGADAADTLVEGNPGDTAAGAQRG
jgi:MFS family permease